VEVSLGRHHIIDQARQCLFSGRLPLAAASATTTEPVKVLASSMLRPLAKVLEANGVSTHRSRRRSSTLANDSESIRRRRRGPAKTPGSWGNARLSSRRAATADVRGGLAAAPSSRALPACKSLPRPHPSYKRAIGTSKAPGPVCALCPAQRSCRETIPHLRRIMCSLCCRIETEPRYPVTADYSS
jgi:hypothetical protein